MNLLVVIGVFTLLAALLILLSVWQKKIEEAQKEQVIADIRDAEQRGTSKAINQHPQIDAEACIGCGSCVEACPEEGVLGMVDGIAHVIHGQRCIGHGRCAVVCPVAAVKIGLGDVSARPDIPVLTEGLESTVPGVYIAGELGGFALIRIATEQGVRVIEEIARDLQSEQSSPETDIADVLIVGAGPAGYAATLKAVELGLSYITIDQEDLGGTIRKYPRRKLTLTGPLVLPLYGRVKREEFLKEELIEFLEDIVADYGVHFETGVKFLGVEQGPDSLVVETSEGPLSARRVVLALGRRGTPRKLDVPGEEQEKVLYQLVDAATYNGEHLLIVGGGDSAIEAATALATQPGNTVTLSYRRDGFVRLKRRNEERIEQFMEEGKIDVLFESTVKRIGKDSVLLTHREDGIEKSLELPNHFVFVCAGGEPPYELLRGFGVRFNGDTVEPEHSEQSEGLTVNS